MKCNTKKVGKLILKDIVNLIKAICQIVLIISTLGIISFGFCLLLDYSLPIMSKNLKDAILIIGVSITVLIGLFALALLFYTYLKDKCEESLLTND